MRKVFRLATNLLLAALLLCAALLVAPTVLGMRSYAVISASMEPALPVGSLIYVQKTAPEAIGEGDVISFSLAGTVATHRVVSADRELSQFTTRGDRNEQPDGRPVPYAEVIGKVVFHVPQLGRLSQWLTPLRAGAVIAALLLLSFLPGPGRKKEKAGA